MSTTKTRRRSRGFAEFSSGLICGDSSGHIQHRPATKLTLQRCTRERPTRLHHVDHRETRAVSSEPAACLLPYQSGPAHAAIVVSWTHHGSLEMNMRRTIPAHLSMRCLRPSPISSLPTSRRCSLPPQGTVFLVCCPPAMSIPTPRARNLRGPQFPPQCDLIAHLVALGDSSGLLYFRLLPPMNRLWTLCLLLRLSRSVIPTAGEHSKPQQRHVPSYMPNGAPTPPDTVQVVRAEPFLLAPSRQSLPLCRTFLGDGWATNAQSYAVPSHQGSMRRNSSSNFAPPLWIRPVAAACLLYTAVCGVGVTQRDSACQRYQPRGKEPGVRECPARNTLWSSEERSRWAQRCCSVAGRAPKVKLCFTEMSRDF